MFLQTFGTLLDNYFEENEISKSDDTLPDHFSIKNKASHAVEKQIRRFVCFSGCFGKVKVWEAETTRKISRGEAVKGGHGGRSPPGNLARLKVRD